MNLRLARYLAGSAFHVRTIFPGGGRRIAVLDRTKRWRRSARSMRARGHCDQDVACACRISRDTLDRVSAFGWRF